MEWCFYGFWGRYKFFFSFYQVVVNYKYVQDFLYIFGGVYFLGKEIVFFVSYVSGYRCIKICDIDVKVI